MADTQYPMEPKVKAASATGGLAAAVTAFVLWVADTQWHTPTVHGDLPAVVEVLAVGLVGAAAAAIAGYWAKHQYRRSEREALPER